MEKAPPQIRVVKKTYFDHNATKKGEWYEVQYRRNDFERWRGYTRYGSVISFKSKSEALDYSLRKKAGALSNKTFTEVIA